MPIYEVQIEQCGHKSDISRSIKSRGNAVITCPKGQSLDHAQLFNDISFNVEASPSQADAAAAEDALTC